MSCWISKDSSDLSQLKIREIKDSAVTKAADLKGLTDEDIDPIKCDDCDPQIHILVGAAPNDPPI